ncbi:hypothetical protein [Metabacillus litoralis]|uniref:hypothetical protein n=1 Tax=Metabacillus litoralis TaxID=152268 RepID=UPI001CFEEF1C|nr:hypothetical protein [Metabacillus litoralis]
MNQLYMSLNKAGFMYKEESNQETIDFILLETYENGTTHSVDVNTFEKLFEDIVENPSYKALSGLHTFKLEDVEYTMTSEEMGYQKYFDKWRELGLLN